MPRQTSSTLLLALIFLAPAQKLHAEPIEPGKASPQFEKPPRLDRLGDPLPKNALARIGTSRFFQPGGASCLAFSHDGKLLASGGRNGLVYIWNAETGKELSCFGESDKTICSLAFSRDGKSIAAEDDCLPLRIRIHEVATGKVIHYLNVEGPALRILGFSEDLATLITGGAGCVRSWDTATGTLRHELEFDDSNLHPLSLALSPDQKSIAYVRKGKGIAIADVVTGRIQDQVKGPTTGIRYLAFSPDGKTLATAGSGGAIWDLHGKGEPWSIGDTSFCAESLQFSSDGKLLVSVESGQTRLWRVSTGQEFRSWQVRTSREARTAALSPNGQVLACAGSSRLTMWDLDPVTERTLNGTVEDDMRSLAISGDGNLLAISGAKCVHLWDLQRDKELRRIRLEQQRFNATPTFCSNGKTLLWHDGADVYRADAATGANSRHFEANQPIGRVASTARGNFALLAGERGSFQIWEIGKDTPLVTLDDADENLCATAFSPDGKLLVAGSYARHDAGNPARLWDVATGKIVHHLESHTGSVEAVAFSPDGTIIATAGADRTVCLWDAHRGKSIGGLLAHRAAVLAVCFSPDSKTVASADVDGDVRLWDVASGHQRAEFAGHRTLVRSLVFSPDGRRLISGSDDGTCLIWDLSQRMSDKGFKPIELSAAEWAKQWEALADTDGAKLHEAIWELIAAKQTVDRVAARLQPCRSLTDREVAALVAQLDSEEFAVRREAMAKLAQNIDSASSALRRIFEGEVSSLEVRRRLENLLDGEGTLSPELLPAWHAIEILEQIGTPEARKVLETLAGGTEKARITSEAKAALKRLEKKHAP